MKNGTFPAVVQLSNLDGQNGFKLDGQSNGDYSGISVGAAGDINGDGRDDLIIGALGYNGLRGGSYVVFGGPGVGSNGVFNLLSLNGTNGFRLDGENNNDYSGFPVSAAGDINGDGHADLIIGAYGYLGLSFLGRSYVVFGGPGVGSGGVFSLSSLNGANGFRLAGENNGDHSGYSVSAAGDINGDGQADLIIGAHGYPGGSLKGRSYVVFGGPGVGSSGVVSLSSLNGSNGFKLDGENNGDWSGRSVGAAEDINGDGYADVIIGAYGYPGSYKGRSYVVFGGPGVGNGGIFNLSSLNGTNGFKLDGELDSSYVGYFVSAAGDINSDGHADLIIGAWGYLGPGYPQEGNGRSYVVFGGSGVGSGGVFNLSSLDGSNGFKLDGENKGDASGCSVSAAGDINGDGQADLIIGAYGYPSGSEQGRSYVVFGGSGVGSGGVFNLSSLNGSNGFKLDGENNGDRSGWYVGAAGDINGDGRNDLIIGAYTYLSGSNRGRSYVVFGGALVNATSTPTSTAIAITPTPTVSTPAPTSTPTPVAPTPTPTASVFPAVLQLSSLNGKNGFKIDGENGGDFTGFFISAAGDINGDGRDDLIIGAHGHNSRSGSSYVVFGGPGVGGSGLFNLPGLNGTNGFRLDGENNGDYSGACVSAAGDVNSDGHADLIIGAYSYLGYSNKGRSYVVFGGPGVGSGGVFSLSSLNGTNGFRMDGENNGDANGISVSAAGDINGDGHDDLIIGAYGYPSGNNKGRSYVVFGGASVGSGGVLSPASLNGTNGFKLDGENNGDWSGWSVSAAGDVNGDGYADVIIGAYGYPGNYKGRSYVVFGGPGVGSGGIFNLSSLNGTNGFKLDGELDNSYSGYSVSPAGDINGDGHADLIIGAWGYLGPSYPNAGPGRSYVVFGGPGVGSTGVFNLSSLNGGNGFKLDGENQSDGSGYSVSKAGDINGDGHADLVVGAYAYSQGAGTGRSYVVFGGPGVVSGGIFNLSSLNGSNGFKLDGENNGDQSGFSVSAAGDINGDGRDDLIIGAYQYPAGGNRGRIYVVFGVGTPIATTSTSTILSSTSAVSTVTPATSTLVPIASSSTPTVSTTPTPVVSTLAPTTSTVSTIASTTLTPTPPVSTPTPVASTITPTTSTLVPTTPSSTPTVSTTPTPAVSTLMPTTSTVSTIVSTTLTPTPSVSTPTPTPAPIPVLVNNQLTLNNGETVVLSPSLLKATETGFDESQLLFTVGDVQNGYFTFLPFNTSRPTQWRQAQILEGLVSFVHVGNQQAPSYQIIVSDGMQSTPPNLAAINFLGAPVIIQNLLNVSQSGSVILTPSALNVDSSGLVPTDIIFQVSDAEHTQFLSTQTGLPVSNFTLADLQSNRIKVVQDGGQIAPSYVIRAVSAQGPGSAPSLVTAHFSNSQGVFAPRIMSNYLSLTQGQPTILGLSNIQAKQEDGQPVADDAIFYISNVDRGQWALTNLPGTLISSFSQAQLKNASVQFTPDGSRSLPGYQLSILDPVSGLQSAYLPASIFFQPINQPPQLMKALPDQTATVGTPFSFAIPFGAFQDPQGETISYSASRFKSSAALPDWLQFDPLNQRFTGTPLAQDFIDVNVTASDSWLATTTDFTITASLSVASNETSTVQKAIIGGIVSGVVGLLFTVFQVCLKRAANKKLQEALGKDSDQYTVNVVYPVGRRIAAYLKITGFMNYTTTAEMVFFQKAVRILLSQLSQRGVNLSLKTMEDSQRDSIINTIATQTQRHFVPRQRCFTDCVAFFQAQLTPHQLETAAPEIADAVVAALIKLPNGQETFFHYSSSPAQSPDNEVEMTSLGNETKEVEEKQEIGMQDAEKEKNEIIPLTGLDDLPTLEGDSSQSSSDLGLPDRSTSTQDTSTMLVSGNRNTLVNQHKQKDRENARRDNQHSM